MDLKSSLGPVIANVSAYPQPLPVSPPDTPGRVRLFWRIAFSPFGSPEEAEQFAARLADLKEENASLQAQCRRLETLLEAYRGLAREREEDLCFVLAAEATR